MKRFVMGQARGQATLFSECLEDYIAEDNPVRVVDVFVEELPLRNLGFTRVDPLDTGRPAYHPAVLLKLYIYGYLNRVQSSRRLERESADREESAIAQSKRVRLEEKIEKLKERSSASKASRATCARHRISRSPRPTPMPASWPPAGAAAAWWATTCRPPWSQSTT